MSEKYKLLIVDDEAPTREALLRYLRRKFEVKGAADVTIVGLMVSLNRMEVGLGGEKSALDEIKETYGFDARAIVTMAEVTEHLYNRECQGRIVINDEIIKNHII